MRFGYVEYGHWLCCWIVVVLLNFVLIVFLLSWAWGLGWSCWALCICRGYMEFETFGGCGEHVSFRFCWCILQNDCKIRQFSFEYCMFKKTKLLTRKWCYLTDFTEFRQIPWEFPTKSDGFQRKFWWNLAASPIGFSDSNPLHFLKII